MRDKRPMLVSLSVHLVQQRHQVLGAIHRPGITPKAELLLGVPGDARQVFFAYAYVSQAHGHAQRLVDGGDPIGRLFGVFQFRQPVVRRVQDVG